MKKTKPSHTTRIKNIFNILAVVASFILVASISLEAFDNHPFSEKSIYSEIQFWVCLYFLFDLSILFLLAENKWKFFKRYFFIFLMAIPYLSLISEMHLQLSQEQVYLMRLLPLLRGAAALVLIVSFVVRKNTTALFISYLIFLASIIYFLTLIFFVVEHGVNQNVKSYADSLWWAAMTVTTIGSTTQPVTVAGKFITTGMAMTGMTIFPIFTAYVTTLINRVAQREFTATQSSKQEKGTATA